MSVQQRTYLGVVELTSPPAQVRQAMLRPEAWVETWRHVDGLELLATGDGAGVGRRYRTTVRAVLPYRLTWEMETRRADAREIAWTVTGDLVGTGHLGIASLGGGTTLTARWSVRPTPTWMVVAWPVLQQVFLRNHDLIMDRGAQHLADHLAAELLGCQFTVAAAQGCATDG